MEETKIPVFYNNQENTQLLNAVKNKFPPQNSNVASSFSPPRFAFPTLKSSGVSALTPDSSPLNQFILGQLNEKRTNGEIVTTGGFELPVLQIGSNDDQTIHAQQNKAGTFEIPLLKSVTTINKSRTNVANIISGIDRIRVEDDEMASTDIDLTMALSCTTKNIASPSNRLLELCSKANAAVENFVFSFIECDRQRKSVLLPITVADVYCQTDISNLEWRHTLMAPTSFGRIICLKYKRTSPLPCIDHRFKVKHKIKRFGFDTKSPDDVILATLKYQR